MLKGLFLDILCFFLKASWGNCPFTPEHLCCIIINDQKAKLSEGARSNAKRNQACAITLVFTCTINKCRAQKAEGSNYRLL